MICDRCASIFSMMSVSLLLILSSSIVAAEPLASANSMISAPDKTSSQGTSTGGAISFPGRSSGTAFGDNSSIGINSTALSSGTSYGGEVTVGLGGVSSTKGSSSASTGVGSSSVGVGSSVTGSSVTGSSAAGSSVAGNSAAGSSAAGSSAAGSSVATRIAGGAAALQGSGASSSSKQSEKPSATPSRPKWSSNFAATKKLARANLREVYGWKMIEHVILKSDLDTKAAKEGDIIWGLLDDDCKWGAKLVAAKDSLIIGHIVAVDERRTLLGASMSHDRRYHSDAGLTIRFDEIVDQDGKSWPIVGRLCRISETTESTTGGPPRLVEVDKSGNIVKAGPTLTDNEKTAFTAARVATAVPLPLSLVMNVVGVPVLLGAASAAYPAFAYNKPVDMKAKHVRQKAFVYGFVTNLPGAFAVAACVQKGDDLSLKAGDHLIVDMTFKDNEFCSQGRFAVTGTVVK